MKTCLFLRTVSIERLRQYGDIPEEIPAVCMPCTGNQTVTQGLKRRCLNGGTFLLLLGCHPLLSCPWLLLRACRLETYTGYCELCQPSWSDAAPVESALLPTALGGTRCPSKSIGSILFYQLHKVMVFFFFSIFVFSPDEIESIWEQIYVQWSTA